MNNLGFIGKKARKLGEGDVPYAVVIAQGGWQYDVLKKYANDDSKAYARWSCNVHGHFTEMGDVYVSEVVDIYAALEQVDGRTPTDDERVEFYELAKAVSKGGSW